MFLAFFPCDLDETPNSPKRPKPRSVRIRAKVILRVSTAFRCEKGTLRAASLLAYVIGPTNHSSGDMARRGEISPHDAPFTGHRAREH
eukprot:6173613-Pleurochrysis_carterae.AAC.1